MFWKLCVFTLRDFFRCPWVFLNVLVLVGVQSLFFNYESGQGHFFGIEYAITLALAGVTTGAMFARADRAETYPILARQVPRASFTGAVMLAAWIVAVSGHALSTLVEALRFGAWLHPGVPTDAWRTPTTYLVGSLPVVIATAFAVGLVALLSAFISPSGVRLGVLAVLVILVMSFDNRNFPIEFMRPVLQRLPPVLAPVAGALKLATESGWGSVAVISVILLAVYAALLVLADLWLSARQELVLD